MNEGILGAIANPQLADVVGALDYRRAQIDKDEAKRKELRMNQLIAQAIPNMAADSPIRKIFEEDPKMGAAISKAYGIPLNDGEAWEKMRSNVAQLHSLAKADPRLAIERANAMKAENDRLGIVDVPLDRWVGGINTAMEKGDQDGVITLFNSLGVTNDKINPVKAEDFTLNEGDVRFNAKGKEIARVNKTYNPNSPENKPAANIEIYNEWKKIKASGDEQGAEAFARANRLMPDWGHDAGTINDVTVAKDNAEQRVKRIGGIYDDVSKTNKMIGNYRTAIDLLDKGTNTGVVYSKLPSIKDSSILFDNIQKNIGMDVLSSGAFGTGNSITDRDVKNAFSIAVPDNLAPPELKKFLQDKVESQEKIRSAYEDAASQLSHGKNLSDLIDMAKAKREQDKKPTVSNW